MKLIAAQLVHVFCLKMFYGKINENHKGIRSGWGDIVSKNGVHVVAYWGSSE